MEIMQSTRTPQISSSAVIDAFIKDRDVRTSSRETYRRTLKKYLDWMQAKNYEHGTVTRAEILQYKDELLASGCSPLTVASYLTGVRQFYNWAETNRYILLNPTRGEIRLPKKRQVFEKEVLTEGERGQLNDYFKSQSLRDFAIGNLVQRTGLRVIEVVRANIEDIKIKHGQRVLEVQGKGRDEKDEDVVLTDEALEPIFKYLETRPKAKTLEPLFISDSNRNKGKRLTTRYVSGLIKEGLRTIGLDSREYTAHSLRHTVGTTIYEITQDLNQVQLALRHRNPATSQIYARKAMKTAAIKHSPLQLIKI